MIQILVKKSYTNHMVVFTAIERLLGAPMTRNQIPLFWNDCICLVSIRTYAKHKHIRIFQMKNIKKRYFNFSAFD